MKDKEQLVLSVSNKEELNKIENNNNLKYINIDITNPKKEIIDYLKTNGHNLSYAEMINGQKGYIYIDYITFKNAENIINNIIENIPKNLSQLEVAKYLYIKLGQLLGYDINTIPEKNEVLNLSAINTINNIWGSITSGKSTNKTITTIYYYLCKLAKIDCKIIKVNNYGYQKNILTIDDKEIITDLTQDIPYIQSGYMTRFFGSFNDELELDRKILYIKDDYSEKKIENIIKTINYKEDNFFKILLLKTQNIINVFNIKPIELGIIYNDIFNKYCPEHDISINNLYINTDEEKQHFILITHNNTHYSFNYTKNTFVELKDDDLNQNIENKRIGIYANEKIPAINTQKLKVA